MRQQIAARPRVAATVIAGLLALGGLIASISSAQNSTPPRKPPARSQPSIPASGQRLRYGASVRGACRTVDHAQINEMRGWGVYTFDPGRVPVIGPAGRRLLPGKLTGSASPPGLDRFASGSTRPADLTQWQVAGVGRQMPADPSGGCAGSIAVAAPDALASTSSITLRRPGPYVYWTFDHTVHWVKVSNSIPEPTPRPCPQDPDQAATSPAPTGSPPSIGGQNWHWTVSTFCTTVKWWSFSVLGSRGSCSAASSGYINQYAAGVRLHLPLGRGKAGGNACGPSALLMAMMQSRRSAPSAHVANSLPDLDEVFDRTMLVPRRKVTPNSFNEFVGGKAGQLLRRLGWKESVMGRLGTDLERSDEQVIDSALEHGPLVISTDLGTEPWGTTGGGHMIVVLGRDPDDPGEYIVYDPAGNYFSDPVSHYGRSSCGSGVLYPRSWLLAFTTGAWYLELGSPPRA